MDQLIGDIGEFDLIDRINHILLKEGITLPKGTLGIGDDCAAFRPQTGHEILLTCDCIVEGRHFLPDRISPFDLGRRAMTLNISDVGAMGGHPLYALISLGLKKETSVSHVLEMYRGFIAELNPFCAAIIGGNLTRSEGPIFIDITVIGQVESGKMVRRSTAKEGDAILVTGFPGQSAAGLRLLNQSPPEENLNEHPLVRAYNRPFHRALEGEAIARSGLATAMIDVSDGLLGDLGHICKESGVGALLYQQQLPVSQALQQTCSQMGCDPLDFVLSDSDDYELIITCLPQDAQTLCELISASRNVPAKQIGTITPDPDTMELVQKNGTRQPLNPLGWDHFAK